MTTPADLEKRSPLWIFTARDNGIARKLAAGNRAIATFSSKGHELFETLHGSLTINNERAEIWLDGSSLLAGVKMLLGVDPKKDYKDKVAEVSLS